MTSWVRAGGNNQYAAACVILTALPPPTLSFPPHLVLCKPMFVLLSSVYTWAGATACLYFFFTAKLLDRCVGGRG